MSLTQSSGFLPKEGFGWLPNGGAVPQTALYTNVVGPRGAPTYMFAEMAANGWRMELVTGS